MGEGTKYINTCMNGDGNLSEAFNFDISNYTQSINLIGYRAMLNSYERFYFQPYEIIIKFSFLIIFFIVY